jgi:hypothetical protein
VLPANLSAHDGLNSSFSIVDFPDPEEAGLVYLESCFGSVHLEQKGEVDAARDLFRYLTRLALGEDESVELIKRIAVDS